MACGKSEQRHDCSARDYGYDEPGFGFTVGLERSRERSIRKALKLAAPTKLGESSSSDILEIARARATQRLVGRRVTRGERIRELAPAPDGPCHQ